MAGLKPCPECKSDEVALTDEDMLNVNAFCITCGYMGESFEAGKKGDGLATEAWNALDRTDYKAMAVELATWLAFMLDKGPGIPCTGCRYNPYKDCEDGCKRGRLQALDALDAAKKAGLL